MTVRYLIPAGTEISIAAEGGDGKRVTKTDLWASDPVLDDGEHFTFRIGRWIATVPKSNVAIARYDGQHGTVEWPE